MSAFHRRLALALLTGMALLAFPQASFAGDIISKKDLQVAIRAFSFAYDLPKGDMEVEVVYDPAVGVSSQEVKALGEMMQGGLSMGARTLRAKPVTVAQLGSSGSRVVYVTKGMQAHYGQIAAKAAQKKLLTFTTDFGCVSQQKCVMAVASEPNIKIEVSRSATNASELEFSQALKLMIREVE